MQLTFTMKHGGFRYITTNKQISNVPNQAVSQSQKPVVNINLKSGFLSDEISSDS